MSDFTDLKSNFTGDLVTLTDPDYFVSIARWAANAQRRPKFVAFVRTPSDVALAIAFARANHLSIAIRGGGHNPAGASSTEGGLVIDLSRHLNQVRVNPEQKLAYVGGGALWETVDKEAIKHGLATVAGTVNHVGPISVVDETSSDLGDRPVSEGLFCLAYFRYNLTVIISLTLGGGYGWLTGKYGLAIDNLVQVCHQPPDTLPSQLLIPPGNHCRSIRLHHHHQRHISPRSLLCHPRRRLQLWRCN